MQKDFSQVMVKFLPFSPAELTWLAKLEGQQLKPLPAPKHEALPPVAENANFPFGNIPAFDSNLPRRFTLVSRFSLILGRPLQLRSQFKKQKSVSQQPQMPAPQPNYARQAQAMRQYINQPYAAATVSFWFKFQQLARQLDDWNHSIEEQLFDMRAKGFFILLVGSAAIVASVWCGGMLILNSNSVKPQPEVSSVQ